MLGRQNRQHGRKGLSIRILQTQGSIDGNTVDMDIERAKFAENSMMYEFSLDRVGGHFKHMKELLQELKT